MTFDDLKGAVKSYTNLTSQEADTRIGASINRHYRRITSMLGMDTTRFVTRSASTTNGVQTVTFSEIEKIDRVLDTSDSSNLRLLQEITPHAQRATQPSTSEPLTWSVQSMTASTVTIRLDTLPQTTYSLQADGRASLADLTGTDEPAFPSSFHDILTWAVVAEELWKKEKATLAEAYETKAQRLQEQLVFHLADSPTLELRQRGSEFSSLTGGSATGGSGSLGGTAYTQTALLTFDRGAGLAPFAVAQTDAAVVTNLDADKLDGQHGSFYLSRANQTDVMPLTAISPVTTDRLIGRDTAGSGAAEEVSVTNGLAFTGGPAIGIANDGVTYARIQNVTAAARLLGRGGAAGSGDVEELAVGTQLTLAATTLNVTIPGSDTHVVFNDGGVLGAEAGLVYNKTTDVLTVAGQVNLGAGGQLVFPATQNASSDANTFDDYEEGTWTPVLGGSGGTSGQTYSASRAGTYVKKGKEVTATFDIILTAKGTITTNLELQGLPFTVENANGTKAVAACTWADFGITGNAAVYVAAEAIPNTTTAGIYSTQVAVDMSAVTVLTRDTTTSVANTTQLRGTLVYRASA